MPAEEQAEKKEGGDNQGQPQSGGDDGGQPVVIRPEPERVVLEWRAPVRPFKKRSRRFWMTAGLTAFLVGVIMVFVEGWMPVATILAFLFLVYAMSSNPPEEVDIQVTTKGFKVGDAKYLWGECFRFWISDRWGQKLVNVDVARLPGRITFLLGEQNEGYVKETISKYLPYEVAKPSWVEKASVWVGKKIPMEAE